MSGFICKLAGEHKKGEMRGVDKEPRREEGNSSESEGSKASKQISR